MLGRQPGIGFTRRDPGVEEVDEVRVALGDRKPGGCGQQRFRHRYINEGRVFEGQERGDGFVIKIGVYFAGDQCGAGSFGVLVELQFRPGEYPSGQFLGSGSGNGGDV